MRVLYLHPNAWTGEHVILAEWMRQGHEVCVLEEKRNLGATRILADHFRSPGDGIATLWYDPRRGAEKVLTWPVDRWFKKDFDGRNFAHRMWMIRAAVRKFQPDAVIASEGFSYGIPAAALKRFGYLRQPLITSFIGGDILDCPEAAVGKRRVGGTGKLIREALEYPEVLRAVSPLINEALLAEGADPARIRIIPSHLTWADCARDELMANRGAIRSEIRRRYRIDSAAPLIVTLGGNQLGKGLQLLLSAWPRVLQTIPGARWLLCGPRDPWYIDEIEPKLASFSGSIVATGPLTGPSVFEHLAAADLHVNPSLCESLNMVTVEAASVGTPTISSDGAGIAYWVRRHDAGMVVPNRRVPELADAIIIALQSPDLLNKWAISCESLASQFKVERVARMLIDCVANLTGKSSPN